MTVDFLLSWLAVMFPLVFSPGPANITFAVAGANLGIRGSVPLLAGIDLVFLLKTLLVGFGFMTWLQDNPLLLNMLQLAGAIYLIYLAHGFIKPAQAIDKPATPKLTIWDGMAIQAINIKAWMLVITMFSVFAPQGDGSAVGVLTLVVMLAVLNLLTHFSWIAFGSTLTRAFAKTEYQNLKNFLFGGSLLLVALWLLLDNPLFAL